MEQPTIHKIYLNTQDKQTNEKHSNCLLNLHKPIENAYGFRVVSAHSPLSSFTFNTFNNVLEFKKQGNFTFPEIGKLIYSETNLSTLHYHEEEVQLNNNVYTSSQLSTALGTIAQTGMSFNVGTNPGTIHGIYTAQSYARRVSLRGYDKFGRFTMGGDINLGGNETIVSAGAVATVVFSSHVDFSNKITYPQISTKINLDKSTVFDEPSLATYLNTLIPNTVFSFVNHKLKIQNNEGTYALRLYANDKLGLEFDNQQFIDIASGAFYQSDHVSDQSTHTMTYLGLSIYGDSTCSKKPTGNQSHASDIVCCLFNDTGVHYGQYLKYTGTDEILKINTSQFSTIGVKLYDRHFNVIDDQSLSSHIEISVYCKK